MMIRTRGRRLVSRLEALERIYDTRGPRVFRVIFEYGGEPTIVTIYRDENRTEIIEPPPPDDDPDEFFGASESTAEHGATPLAQPYGETTGDPDSELRTSASRVRHDRDEDSLRFRSAGARHAVPTLRPPFLTACLGKPTTLTPPGPLEPHYPALPWSWSLCSHEGNNNHDYQCPNEANRNNAKKSTGPLAEERQKPRLKERPQTRTTCPRYRPARRGE